VDITYAIVDIDYVVQCPLFMDIETLQNEVTAKSHQWPLSGFSLIIHWNTEHRKK